MSKPRPTGWKRNFNARVENPNLWDDPTQRKSVDCVTAKRLVDSIAT